MAMMCVHPRGYGAPQGASRGQLFGGARSGAYGGFTGEQDRGPCSVLMSSTLPYSFRPSSSSSSTGVSPESGKPIGHGAFGVVWSLPDPNYDRRIAVKKLPNVFQGLVSARRVYRELKILCSLKHENVLSASDILQPCDFNLYTDIYVVMELMASDLHRIIVSPQALTSDHIKVFIYQILRGLKYLHSAHIIHRDIKPGNLLVNANCCLKICDFGLARVEELDDNITMTHEVVTQYYRAPEILMGARHYTSAVDIWSVGCILAELLSRRILFQARSPLQQLELILDVLGTPSPEDVKTVCEPARQHVLRKNYRQPNLSVLYELSRDCSHEVVHLLCELLVFNPERRISAANALTHPYLEDGRLRYHLCMCSCEHRSKIGIKVDEDLEPVCMEPFSYAFEDGLSSMSAVRDKIHSLCFEMQQRSGRVLYFNPNSQLFRKLSKSQCAQPSDLPSPHIWE